MSELPPNVYRVAQRRFDAIPGSPWVYWVSESLRRLFEILPDVESVSEPIVGCFTCDNPRFVRWWWETGTLCLTYGATQAELRSGDKVRWVPYMKGGQQKWYSGQWTIVNYARNGLEIRERRLVTSQSYTLPGESKYAMPGVVFPHVTSRGFSAQLMPDGFIFDTASMGVFPEEMSSTRLLGTMNSKLFNFLLYLVNPTINFQKSDVAGMPISVDCCHDRFEQSVLSCIHRKKQLDSYLETAFVFTVPLRWHTGIADQSAAAARLAALEAQINDEVYRLYGISDADRAVIEAELAGGGGLDHEGGEGASFAGVGEDAKDDPSTALRASEREEDAAEGAITREDLAVRWISYAVGIVLGRFQPGDRGALGSAIYHRDGFAIGSLPAPAEAEFDELVGPPERFATVDAEGGRHLFAPEVEAALRALALTDGIAVLDEGHPRDLPALVERALRLMLEDASKSANGESRIVNDLIQVGANGDLRAFLLKEFFTRWHLRWYRKRPVYWPLQSGKRSYGFVLFHERVDRLTLYTLQRDYLDYKLNAVRQQVADLNQAAAMQSGATRRATEREAARAAALLDELTEFARTMERIVRAGYEPEANWIDDGVILRLAPLWELLPLWKAEPKKYWERLERGDFDWSHIAMKYWPARVREKCKTNKSFAIAHGHDEWYKGG